MKYWLTVLLLIFVSVVVVTPRSEAKTVSILATVGMIADVAREVAGPDMPVTTLIGEGIDPHLYKPTRRDVLELSRADIIFYNGLHLEGRMIDSLQRIKRSGKPVFAVAELLAEDQLLADDENPENHDPHIWMDVSLWSRGVERIARSLCELHPERCAGFQERSVSYQARLARLDRYIKDVMATVPESRRILITAHDAFGYFGKAYHIKVMGIQGISTESEAGLNDINRLVDTLISQNIQAICAETSVADRNVKALIEGARSRGHTVTIGGNLFSDAMGAAGTYEGTYIGMLDHNASTIARALGGQVPDGGFRQWEGETYDSNPRGE